MQKVRRLSLVVVLLITGCIVLMLSSACMRNFKRVSLEFNDIVLDEDTPDTITWTSTITINDAIENLSDKIGNTYDLYDICYYYSTNEDEALALQAPAGFEDSATNPYSSYSLRYPNRCVKREFTQEERELFAKKYDAGFVDGRTKNNSMTLDFIIDDIPLNTQKVVLIACVHGKDQQTTGVSKEMWNNVRENCETAILYSLVVNYECDGVSLGTKTIHAQENNKITINCPNFEGYEPLQTSVDFIMEGEPCKVTVPYKVQTFTVGFDALNGGSSPESQQVLYHGFIKEPVVVANEGFELEGWYTEPEYINKWDFKTDKVSGDMTLYAKWNKVGNYNGEMQDAIIHGENSNTYDADYMIVYVLFTAIALSAFILFRKFLVNKR